MTMPTAATSSPGGVSPPPPPPPPRRGPRRRGRDRHDDGGDADADVDRAVRSTADDAALAKLSCVARGYYDDPFAGPMARDAAGLVGGGRAAGGGGRGGGGRSHPRHGPGGCGPSSSSATEPLIRRGTHARVRAVERAIDAFLSLTAPRSEAGGSGASGSSVVGRQVVVLGAGRDTSYLRYRFGKEKATMNFEDVRWFEVDHPSIVRKKARSWLPGCVPAGHHCAIEPNRDAGASYAVRIAPKKNEGDEGDDDRESSNYHLVGHDLRSPPAALFEALSHPVHGYDRSIPTLFVLECAAMYLPDGAARGLLRGLAGSPTVGNEIANPFAAVVLYDPIPSDDRFGRLMIDNLRRAGITSGREGRAGTSAADDDDEDGDRSRLSLETTLTLADQLSRLVGCGFDVAVGCDMMDAYDHGVISAEDRRRAARCEMLDELEEFVLLMRHYCLVVGVSRPEGAEVGCDEGLRLCAVGEDSPVGFREGRCAVLRQEN